MISILNKIKWNILCTEWHNKKNVYENQEQMKTFSNLIYLNLSDQSMNHTKYQTATQPYCKMESDNLP
jgi:transcriptional antiterminator